LAVLEGFRRKTRKMKKLVVLALMLVAATFSTAQTKPRTIETCRAKWLQWHAEDFNGTASGNPEVPYSILLSHANQMFECDEANLGDTVVDYGKAALMLDMLAGTRLMKFVERHGLYPAFYREDNKAHK
jgi:hypothetical protein